MDIEAHKTLREQILAADDIEHREVTVPEWGDLVLELRTPTVEVRGELLGKFINQGTGKIDYISMYPSLLVSVAYVPGTDERVFTLDDVPALTQKSSAVLERLGAIAIELSGLEKPDKRIEVGKDSSTPILNSLTSTD